MEEAETPTKQATDRFTEQHGVEDEDEHQQAGVGVPDLATSPGTPANQRNAHQHATDPSQTNLSPSQLAHVTSPPKPFPENRLNNSQL